MSRAETIEAVLSLLPGRPGSDSKQARQRLQQLSSGELRRMFEHLASLPESRPLTNTRRRQWEKAYARASSLSTLEPLLADWQQINQRSALWMGELAAQQGVGATPASAPAEAAVAEEPLQALARSVSGHEWAEPLDLARATLDPRFDESGEMAVLAMAVSDRFTQVGFDARLQAFTAYREAAVAANRNEGADLRQYDIDLSHILPWDWLLARLIALRMHLEGKGAGLPQRDRLCILRLLTVLRRETWPDALASDSGPDLDEIRVFIALVNTLWAYPASFVPSGVVGSLIRLLDAGVITLRSIRRIEMEQKKNRLASLSIIRALFLVYWFREESGDFSVANRVRNLAPAFNAAENAGFLFSNTALVERRMLDALRSSTANIPPLPETYLSLVGGSRVKDVGEFKLLKDAGDVMRLQAHVSLLTSHDLDHAKELLLVAEAYYRHALVFANDEGYLYQHIEGTARIRLLQGTVARKAGRPEEAANLMQQALVEIDQSGVPKVGGLLYQKCLVMINQARSSPTSVPDDAIIATIKELITDGANRFGGWNLLLEYYLAKQMPEMALHIVSEWSKHLKGVQDCPTSLMDYVNFRKASLLRAILTIDPTRLNETIEAYISVILQQPKNTNAMGELLEICRTLSEEDLAALRSHVTQAIPDTGGAAWPHAAIRSVFNLPPLTSSSNVVAAAFGELMRGEHGGETRFGKLLGRSAFSDRVILELLSKYYFNRGRDRHIREYMLTADRLLRSGLLADPMDVVWISRRIDIALAQRDAPRVHELLEAGLRISPNDPILQFQGARTDLVERRFASARAKLKHLLINTSGAAELTGDFHPAVVDQLAVAALQDGDFAEAERWYRLNLEAQPLDPRALIGAGRVLFERGPASWSLALRNWGQALLLQIDMPRSSGMRFARSSAALIAGLLNESAHKNSIGAAAAMEQELTDLLKRDTKILGYLAPAFHSRRIGYGAIAAVVGAAETFNDLAVNREVAEILRARNIFDITVMSPETLVVSAVADVEWCLNHRVLVEYLAGVRESYFRALLRKQIRGEGIISPPPNAANTWLGAWRNLADHIASDLNVAPYRIAAELTQPILDRPVLEIARFSLFVAQSVLSKFASFLPQPEKTIAHCTPEIGLIRNANIGKLDASNPPRLSPWADEDMFNLATRFMNGSGWANDGGEIVRSLRRTPTSAEIAQFGRGGIYFRSDNRLQGQMSAYVSIVPEWARSTYELEGSEIGV